MGDERMLDVCVCVCVCAERRKGALQKLDKSNFVCCRHVTNFNCRCLFRLWSKLPKQPPKHQRNCRKLCKKRLNKTADEVKKKMK